MTDRLYNIIDSFMDGKYLYEIVESGGQKGIRCRIYLTKDDLFGDCLYKWDTSKYGSQFRKFMLKRYPQQTVYKFEAFTWCWPFDTFDPVIGRQMTREKVDNKINIKKTKIRKFIKNLEKNNLPKKYKEKMND